MDFPLNWQYVNSVHLFTYLHYRCAPYVDAAIRLQALGKKKACRDLLQLAKWEDKQSDMSGYRAMVLCRMLFVAKHEQQFPLAGTGEADFIGGTTYSNWPLEPIILIDQVPFIIAREYGTHFGPQIPPSWAVQSCIQNCDWSHIKYHSLTQSQKEQALQKLYALPVWKGHLTATDQAFFAQQIASP